MPTIGIFGLDSQSPFDPKINVVPQIKRGSINPYGLAFIRHSRMQADVFRFEMGELGRQFPFCPAPGMHVHPVHDILTFPLSGAFLPGHGVIVRPEIQEAIIYIFGSWFNL